MIKLFLVCLIFLNGCAEKKEVKLSKQEPLASITAEDLAMPDYFRNGIPYVIIPIQENGKAGFVELQASFYLPQKVELEPNYEQVFYKEALKEKCLKDQ